MGFIGPNKVVLLIRQLIMKIEWVKTGPRGGEEQAKSLPIVYV